MGYKLQVVIIPVSDVDRAKAFYLEQAGFSADYDMAPDASFRIVQLTPHGSSASIAVGVNLTHTPAEPGSAHGLRLVVEDIDAAVADLGARGCKVTAIDGRPWGRFAWFSDPDVNGWELNQPAQQG